MLVAGCKMGGIRGSGTRKTEKKELPGGRQYLQEAVESMGAWTIAEKKTLVLLLLAVSL